ncbi:hypothetical protein NFHSH190041_27000 [Shewanella sp. NFH-SH190041]|uniref:helix-turn-helix transcriptional regulator n=1 Tax=Shewanella sp. NFH-SH190041 TaxID=2950245 RepID=UPI0021FBF6CE|nr:response regulator transcription factor [Shewanella sp. NFH-SH190041]BDM65248.1 hypothetical protein NFHSH190041_27000 [Shewanella sp. NFH-SH190041]
MDIRRDSDSRTLLIISANQERARALGQVLGYSLPGLHIRHFSRLQFCSADELSRADLLVYDSDSLGLITDADVLPREFPGSWLIILRHTTELALLECVTQGFAGALDSHQPPDTYATALRSLLLGELWYPRHIIALSIKQFQQAWGKPHKQLDWQHCLLQFDLTCREREIGALLAQGYSNKDIAEHLYISQNTVKTHVSKVLQKMGVNSRGELTAKLSAGQLPTAC